MMPQRTSTAGRAAPTATRYAPPPILVLSAAPAPLRPQLQAAGLDAPLLSPHALPCQPAPDALVLLDTAGLTPAQLARLLVRLAAREERRRRSPFARVVGLVEARPSAAPGLRCCGQTNWPRACPTWRFRPAALAEEIVSALERMPLL